MARHVSVRIACAILWCSTLFFASSAFALEDGLEMHILSDGTLSWDQPDSTGAFGYNGYCGQTAAANIVSMLANPESPDFVRYYCEDITPGVLPTTIADYLSDRLGIIFRTHFLQPDEALTELKKALKGGAYVAKNNYSPVAVLIKSGAGKQYHWITIVRIEDGTVYFNEYGKQNVMTTRQLMYQWSFTGDGGFWKSTLGTVGCVPLTMVTQDYPDDTDPES